MRIIIIPAVSLYIIVVIIIVIIIIIIIIIIRPYITASGSIMPTLFCHWFVCFVCWHNRK